MFLVLDDTLYADVLPAQVSASSNVCIMYQYSSFHAVSIKTLKKWFQESSTKREPSNGCLEAGRGVWF